MSESLLPLISVIIPAYSARRYLGQALASVRAQTWKNWEIIVVDDCSSEFYDDIVSAFCETVPDHTVRLIRHETNQRLGGARNTGIDAAKGTWIAFLDHDDLWRSTHLEDSLNACTQNDCEISYADFELFHENPGDFTGDSPPAKETWGRFPDSLYVHNFIQPSAVVMKTSLARDLGGFSTRPEIHMCEDLELWIRLAGLGCRFASVPKKNLLYRKHAEAATANLRRILAAKAHVLFLHRDTIKTVPWFFRHRRTAIVCSEAARWSRGISPGECGKLYRMAFYAAPWKLRYLAAAGLFGFFSPSSSS